MCGGGCTEYSSGAVAAGSLNGTWTSKALPLTPDFQSYQSFYLNGITCLRQVPASAISTTGMELPISIRTSFSS